MDTLQKINSKILQELAKEEEIQTMIEDSDKYILVLKISLAELTKNVSYNKTIENSHQSTSQEFKAMIHVLISLLQVSIPVQT